MNSLTIDAENIVDIENEYGAHNYHPLPVILTKGKGVYVWDEEGKKYLDMLCAYSAVSHGHCHPQLIKVLNQQAHQLTLVSRAFYTDKLAPLLKQLCELTGQEAALPMNTGAEAVETAIKAVRKWAYTIKGVEESHAEIIACHNNFHGRTTTIIGMSSEAQYRNGFGPFAPGFKLIPYGNPAELEKAITPNTAAFLVEPIQGEGGIIVPPEGYLKACEDICRQNNVLLICDEIQTGLGRTGKFLASDHERVVPDGVILGKALGGGLLPISMFLTSRAVMDVFTPGDHGSTFGGNPLACAVAQESLKLLFEENLIEHAAEMGDYFQAELKKINSPLIKNIRGKGLLIGLEIDPVKAAARTICVKLLEQGLLSKETHATVVRLAPPLNITKKQIDDAVKILRTVLCSENF
jgi:ornithine--oxo-acid transaminase